MISRMLNSVIENHPCLKYNDLLQYVCKPLQEYGITFFGFTAIDKEGAHYCLGSKPEYAKQYLLKNLVQEDIQYRPQQINGHLHYYFWDFIQLSTGASEIYQMAANFDQSHTLTIVRHDEDMTRCYHFSGQLNDDTISQRYLSYLDGLQSYIEYFDNCLEKMPELRRIFDYPYLTDLTKQSITPISIIKDDPRKVQLAEQANTGLCFIDYSKYYLTAKERRCLYWLYRGKSAEMTSQILNVSRKTVERHIANIKQKYNCYTQFQLGIHISQNKLTHLLDREIESFK